MYVLEAENRSTILTCFFRCFNLSHTSNSYYRLRHPPDKSNRVNVKKKNAPPEIPPLGIGQLSLVEHALCPLESRRLSVNHGGVHLTSHQFTDSTGRRKTARVRISSPLGLTPTDEFYLWGLLALTFSQPEPIPEFFATPHYCLRQLQVIDQHSKRGGRQYRLFAESLARLAAVNYQNDGFYDPIRREHRRISFGFLSYSLPLDDDSSRAWRIVWNSLFFEMVQAIGGHLWFDLNLYRQLDPASRRLFLLLCKFFRRKQTSPRIDLQELGVQVMGFAPSLSERDLKIKVRRAASRLEEHHIVGESVIQSNPTERRSKTTVQFSRGTYFRKDRTSKSAQHVESPLTELMRVIGLDDSAIRRCLRDYKHSVLQQWIDITLAARERRGESFFRRSAAAYFFDNVKHAATGNRTPPDWWHDLQRQERQRRPTSRGKSKRQSATSNGKIVEPSLSNVLYRQFRELGQPEDVARTNAERFARTCEREVTPGAQAAILQLLK